MSWLSMYRMQFIFIYRALDDSPMFQENWIIVVIVRRLVDGNYTHSNQTISIRHVPIRQFQLDTFNGTISIGQSHSLTSESTSNKIAINWNPSYFITQMKRIHCMRRKCSTSNSNLTNNKWMASKNFSINTGKNALRVFKSINLFQSNQVLIIWVDFKSHFIKWINKTKIRILHFFNHLSSQSS